MALLYKTVITGNLHISLYSSDKRNKNHFKIHSNNIGRTIFETFDVYDSDVLKIIRTLEQYEYSYKSYTEIFDKLEKNTRHLKIFLSHQ